MGVVCHRSFRSGPSRTFIGLAAVLALLATLLAPGAFPAAAAADDDGRAVAQVSEEQGIPVDQLTVVNAETGSLPLTRLDREDFKVVADDGRSFAVSFRDGTDEVIDPDEDIAAEADERERRRGRIAPGLANRMPRGNARVPVAIWVTMDDAAAHGRRRNQAGYAAVEARAKAARAPVAAEARRFGAAAKTAEADLAPVVFAELNAGQINGLSRRPDVERIEDIPEVEAHLDDSATSSRWVYAWTGAKPLTGRFSRVAVHEAGGVDNVNPAMPPVRYWSDTQGNPRNIQGHPTNVAGVVGSRHPWRRGGAFQVEEILSANFPSYASPTSQFVASAMWAVRSGADVVNMSWGTVCSGGNQDFFSRWVDYTVHTFGVSIVSSAGNSACPGGVTGQYVGSPSLGWNTISVGSYFDNNNGLRGDDVLSAFSSWRNPVDVNSGQTYEKPDVVANGGQVAGGSCFGVETLAIGSGFDSTCGTSFSSPETAALVAGITGREPKLANSPETVKAIVMAGATHNVIDGVNYRACPSSPIAGDCRDGAGGIDAFQTRAIVRDEQWVDLGHVTPASWPAGEAGDKQFFLDLTAGQPMRAVLAWNSSADCVQLGTASQACASDVLNADLDLLLFNPGGTLVASAASIRNSVEVIDYTPPTSGIYTLRARNFSFQANTSTYAGLAVSGTTDTRNNPLVGQTILPLNQTTTLQTTRGGASFWDAYEGTPASCVSFMNFSTGPEKVYRVQTTQPGSLTATISQISQDPSGLWGNIDLDVAILTRPSGVPNHQMNQHMIACGDSTATATNLPAGTYWIVVDGFAGAVARHRIRADFTPTGGSSPPAPQPLPDR